MCQKSSERITNRLVDRLNLAPHYQSRAQENCVLKSQNREWIRQDAYIIDFIDWLRISRDILFPMSTLTPLQLCYRIGKNRYSR